MSGPGKHQECWEFHYDLEGLKKVSIKFRLTPVGVLASMSAHVRHSCSAHHRPERKFFKARLCRVNFKHLPNPQKVISNNSPFPLCPPKIFIIFFFFFFGGGLGGSKHLGILVFRTPMTTPFMILQFVPPKSSFLEEEGGSTKKKKFIETLIYLET